MGEEKDLTHIFEIIAEENNTTVEEVRKEIEIAIQSGFNSNDHKARSQWAKIPKKGEVPTPDELIDYIILQSKLSNFEGLS
ncbi:MAG: sporulation initiation factor Spo0A C-terminal domain-containing protein [Eubacteriales bacterium]